MANTLNKITTKSILDATVATADIAADAVTGAKIADDAIDSEHYTDGSIDTAHIADDAVTADKLANAINTDIAAKAVLTGSTNNTITTVTGANAIQGESKLTFDGDTLKFTHDAVTGFDSNSQDFLVIENGDSDTYINIATETTRDSGLLFSDGDRARGYYNYNHNSDYASIGVAGSERFRIDSSGKVIVKTSGINLENATATNSRTYSITNAAGSTGWTFGNGVTASAHQFVIYDNTAGAGRMLINANGQITTPYQPCFHAKGTSSWISLTTGDGNTDLPMSYELFDNGGNYDNSTYTFTAPVAGKYLFFVQMYFKFDSNAGYFSNYFTKNNTSYQENHQLWGYGNTGLYEDQTQSATAMMELSANDYVRYVVRTVGDDADFYAGHCTFSGYLLA